VKWDHRDRLWLDPALGIPDALLGSRYVPFVMITLYWEGDSHPMGRDEDKELAELDTSFSLMVGDTKAGLEYEQIKLKDKSWKQRDPEGFKKDMEEMCKSMFGDNWQVEYEAMLKEEFPEEFSH
jgi:hypothetical protein